MSRDVAATPPPGTADQKQIPDPQRWRALSVCLASGFLTLLGISIVNVALPSIQEDLSASASDLQWVVSGYALASGLLLVPGGRLGDARGRRRVFLAGLAAFIVASLLAGLAPTALLLSAARFAQGLATGFVTPQVSGLIQQMFVGAERGQAFGLFGATVGTSIAIGPLAGGVILDLVGGPGAWRWLFLINVPLGLLVWWLGYRLLPRNQGPVKDTRLDPIGTVLIGAAALLLMVPLLQDSASGRSWWLMGPGAALIVVFVAWERRFAARGRQPVMDLALFRQRSYTLGMTISTSYFGGYSALFIILTLTLQQGLHYSPLAAGLTQLPFAVGETVAAAIGGRMVNRFGRVVPAVGVACTMAGVGAAGVLGTWTYSIPYGWVIAPALLVGGIGAGLTISPNQALTLAQVPVSGGGSAAGVMQTSQRLSSALGIAIVSAVFFAWVSHGGDYLPALSIGLWVCVGIQAIALVAALADLALTRRAGGHRGL